VGHPKYVAVTKNYLYSLVAPRLPKRGATSFGPGVTPCLRAVVKLFGTNALLPRWWRSRCRDRAVLTPPPRPRDRTSREPHRRRRANASFETCRFRAISLRPVHAITRARSSPNVNCRLCRHVRGTTTHGSPRGEPSWRGRSIAVVPRRSPRIATSSSMPKESVCDRLTLGGRRTDDDRDRCAHATLARKTRRRPPLGTSPPRAPHQGRFNDVANVLVVSTDSVPDRS